MKANHSRPYHSRIPFEVDAAVMASAMIVGLGRMLAGGADSAFGMYWEQMAMARSLATGGGFSNPFQYTTGPSAVLAPVHPLLMAGVLLVFGDRPQTAVPLMLMEALIYAGSALLLVRIGCRLFHSWWPGVLAAAGMLMFVHPIPQWENGLAQLMAEVIFLLLLDRGAAVAGVATGVAWLVSPALLPFSIAVAYVLRGARYSGIATAIAIAVVSPWVIRNSVTFQAPIFIRDSYGLELFMSNNDLAVPRQNVAKDRYQKLHPNENAEAAAELVRQGEPAYFAGLQEATVEWIQKHPIRFLELTGARIGLWWASTWAAAGLSIVGFLGLWRFRGTAEGIAAAAALFLFSLPYYIIQFDPRYQYPVLWLLLLFAGGEVHRYRKCAAWVG